MPIIRTVIQIDYDTDTLAAAYPDTDPDELDALDAVDAGVHLDWDVLSEEEI